MTFTALPSCEVLRSSLADRFWTKVNKTDGCWLWTASLARGYGQIEVIESGRRRNLKAHRVAYELTRGPIPGGLHIDHLCRNTRCVNPDHLEPVTGRENTLRGEAGLHRRAQAERKSFCPNGHEMTPANTYHPPKRPTHKHCRACAREANRAWLERKRSNGAAA